MGREMRRSQERAERRQKQRDAVQARRPQMSVAANPSAPGGERTGFSPRRWFGDIVAELKKVTWPSRREVANLTTVVIVISMLLGLMMGGADLLFGWLVEQTLLR